MKRVLDFNAMNISTEYRDGKRVVNIVKSTLPYNDRRRFGSRPKRLYDYLGSLPRGTYDHDSLVSQLDVKAPPASTACGTVACAFGHAVTSGKFAGIHGKFTVDRDARIDNKGRVDEDGISYKYNLKAIAREAKARGFNREHLPSYGAEAAAEIYFGPGAWEHIFDTCAYGHGRATKADVRKRIKEIATKAYGVKF